MPKDAVIAVPQDLVAVVLDTNSMPKGQLDIRRIEELASIIEEQELDAEIWIPEPVVWEWTEHLFRSVRDAAAAYGKALTLATEAGLIVGEAAVPEVLADVQVISSNVEAAVEALEGVRILRLADAPHAAVDGLRDQVLQLGTGRRKSAGSEKLVKTGGADSAALRLVTHAMHGRPLALAVVVSADRDTVAHFGATTPVIIPQVWAVKQSLLALENGSDAARTDVEEALFKQVVGDDSETVLGAELNLTSAVARRIGPEMQSYLNMSVALIRVSDLTDFRGVEVSRTDGYATAEASAIVDLQVDGVWWDAESDRLEITPHTLYDLPAEAQMSAARLDDGWHGRLDSLRAD